MFCNNKQKTLPSIKGLWVNCLTLVIQEVTSLVQKQQDVRKKVRVHRLFAPFKEAKTQTCHSFRLNFDQYYFCRGIVHVFLIKPVHKCRTLYLIFHCKLHVYNAKVQLVYLIFCQDNSECCEDCLMCL